MWVGAGGVAMAGWVADRWRRDAQRFFSPRLPHNYPRPVHPDPDCTLTHVGGDLDRSVLVDGHRTTPPLSGGRGGMLGASGVRSAGLTVDTTAAVSTILTAAGGGAVVGVKLTPSTVIPILIHTVISVGRVGLGVGLAIGDAVAAVATGIVAERDGARTHMIAGCSVRRSIRIAARPSR